MFQLIRKKNLELLYAVKQVASVFIRPICFLQKHQKIEKAISKMKDFTARKLSVFGAFLICISHIQTEYGKIWTRKTPSTRNFHAMFNVLTEKIGLNYWLFLNLHILTLFYVFFCGKKVCIVKSTFSMKFVISIFFLLFLMFLFFYH